MLVQPRYLAKVVADLGGYFWLPCPVCNEHFAGFEAGRYGVPKPNDPDTGLAVCCKQECQIVAKAAWNYGVTA